MSRIEADTPIDLAVFRQYYIYGNSSQSQVIVELIDLVASLRGWDLPALEVKAKQIIAEREADYQKKLANQRKTEEAISLNRQRKNFIKKHGRAPPDRARV